MRRILVLGFTAVLAASCFAGWERTFGGSQSDAGFSVVQTSDGGYAVAGYSNSFGAGNYDAYLIKTTATGDTQWTSTYDAGGDEAIQSMAQSADGGYVLAGWTGPYSHHDVYIVKFSATGDFVWAKSYGGIQDDEANAIAQTSDGGFIVAGLTQSFDEGAWGDFYLLKLDSMGDTVWTRIYGGLDTDIGFATAQTSDGGYIIAGYTNSFTGEYVYVVKTTSTGDTLWTRTYVGDVPYSIAQTSDGGYILAGWTYYDDYDVHFIKLNATGDIVWTRIYGGSDEDEVYSIAQTSDGGYIAAGYTSSYGAGDEDFYLIKLDSSGDTLWTRTFGGSGWDYAQSVAQTSDGGYIIAGYTESFGAGGNDVYLVKTNSLGYTLIDETSRPANFSLSAHPNPFNSAMTISLDCGSESPEALSTSPRGACRVEVFDINGRRIEELRIDDLGFRIGDTEIAERQSSINNHQSAIWTPDESLGSGVYLVRASFDGETAAKRVVYLK